MSERGWRIGLVLLVIATVLIRSPYFGNPLIDVDEQFYLLTGDRMLHGALPYVDIWDRKPVGLFLLYAAMRLLGGDGILQYQLVATGFVAATAVVIAFLGRRISSPGAGLVAGLLYVPALAMSGGQGGQTPVFYNLPMIVAAWLVLRLVVAVDNRTASPAGVRRRGMAVMLLVGLALQIKYSAVFEGVFFGLALLWCAWRANPRPIARIADAGIWIAVALLPTALGYGAYVAMGDGPAWIFANLTSIFARLPVSASHQWHDLARIAVRLLVFAVPILVGELLRRRRGRTSRGPDRAAKAHMFVACWLAAAIVGFAAFGTFFDHYALPLLPPLAILAAPAFAIHRRHVGAALATLSLSAVAIAYPLDAAKYARRNGDAAWAARIVAIVRPRLHGECLYVFDGAPIYYHLTGSCLPTRFAFPFHLSLSREGPALGVDPLAETRRILANRPPVIIDRLTDGDEVNLAVQAVVRGNLCRDYRLVFHATHGNRDPDTDQVWERISGR